MESGSSTRRDVAESASFEAHIVEREQIDTMVNVLADAVCTVIVARLAGDRGALRPAGEAPVSPPQAPESSSPRY